MEGNFKLGQWVSVQRYRKDLLKVERKRRLDAIGFIWDWKGDYVWEQNFAALLKFKRRRGHCRVPISYSEGNLKLGLWVSTQRRNTLVMSAERRARLNKIEIYVEDAHVPHRVDRQNFVVASSHVRKRSGGRAIFAAIRRASSRKVLEIKCDALGFSTEAG